MNGFGERLKKLRKSANITQTALAEKLNVHSQTVSRWERDSSAPDIAMYGMLSHILGVSLEELWGLPTIEESVDGQFDTYSLGRAIATARKQMNESQDNLANAVCVSSDTVSKWERGLVCPDPDTFLILAKHFNVSPSALYYGQVAGPREVEVIETIVTSPPKSNKKRIILSAVLGVLLLSVTAVAALLFSLKPFNPTAGGDVECTHQYEADVTPPTCSAQGYTTYTCTECGDSYKSDYVSALPHAEYRQTVTQPTCSAQGFTTYTCTECGYYFNSDYTSILPHTPGEWIIDREPTCFLTGSRHRECKICKTTLETSSIEKLAHSYEYIIVPPEGDRQGYYLYTCELCGDSYKDNYFLDDNLRLLINFDYADKTCVISGVDSFNDEEIIIPSTVNGCKVIAIAGNAFEDCATLKRIVIPDTVEEIGKYAFHRCVLLEEIVIPDSVKYIGDEAFCGCRGLISATLPEGLTEIKYSTFSDCVNLRTVNIPANVEVIEDLAFNNCHKLQGVVLPEGLKMIGRYTFSYCEKLEKINIPRTVIRIGDNAFSGCTSLISVEFGQTYGWVADEIEIESNLLADCRLAAEYLTEKYNIYIWIRKQV